MNKLKELKTVTEVKEMFSMIGRLVGTMIESALSTLTIIILIGKLLTKPVEIAIAMLTDIRNLVTPKKKETKKEAESEKDSSSSSFLVGLYF